MDNAYNVHEPSLLDTVIDIEKTSLKLKEIRVKKNIKVSDLQKEFKFENPQAIYLWENPEKKTLPSLDNLVRLAKFYNTSIDELLVIKVISDKPIIVSESVLPSPYNISQDVIDFVKNNSSQDVLNALRNYYSFYS